MNITLEKLFDLHGFKPNGGQKEAITSLNGPLFLMAGPGSGKTRVLLWRVVNLLVFHQVKPEKIFLSTFTEKAAKQLKDGLQSILGTVTNQTGVPYDISRMYVGTIHSLCQRILGDRRFVSDRSRRKAPVLMDELEQYFFVNSAEFWKNAEAVLQTKEEELREEFRSYLKASSHARHSVSQAIIAIINRFSEENLCVKEIMENAGGHGDKTLKKLAILYEWYKNHLDRKNLVDFSLIQQKALHLLMQSDHSIEEFEHIIIDEYQDTNRVQEQLIFRMAQGYKNVCVVGDDDQALYRFRGATVENFVQFPDRCRKYLGVDPKRIRLNINYRSRYQIVQTYKEFIDKVSWAREDGKGYYRIHDKNIQAHSKDKNVSVITSSVGDSDEVVKEIAEFVKRLVDEKKVEDPNQIAFLFPALKGNTKARKMKEALEKVGLKVYAPRAGKFLDVEEARAMFGLLLHVLGKPQRNEELGGAYKDFHDWMTESMKFADGLMEQDQALSRFAEKKKEELERALADYWRLLETVQSNGWQLTDFYDPSVHKRQLESTPGLSAESRKGLGTSILDRIAKERIEEGNPFTLRYILNRATSMDWNVLDLFYRFCGFGFFAQMFKLAEDGKDEGPICNLSMISNYLARYIEQTRRSVITGEALCDDRLVKDFFGRFVYGLFRLGESEYEDQETPFPKGRIPFLTIHQSKGLEFPYVVLGSLQKQTRVQRNEEIIRQIVTEDSEPLDKVPEFDAMRLFYVALSRAEKVLILARHKGRGISTFAAFNELFSEMKFQTIPETRISKLPAIKLKHDEIPKVYSYTSDYLLYLNCPRNYMVFRKYGFVPSRSQTMFFGTLVHKTIEDLHSRLISIREGRI